VARFAFAPLSSKYLTTGKWFSWAAIYRGVKPVYKRQKYFEDHEISLKRFSQHNQFINAQRNYSIGLPRDKANRNAKTN
jgi:hypothetical protein